VTLTPNFFAFSTISKRFLAPTADAKQSVYAHSLEWRKYQFQPHKYDCTSITYQRLWHCEQGRFYVRKESSVLSFYCFHNQSSNVRIEIKSNVQMALIEHPWNDVWLCCQYQLVFAMQPGKISWRRMMVLPWLSWTGLNDDVRREYVSSWRFSSHD